MTSPQTTPDVADLERRVAELQRELAEARRERDEYKDLVQRTPAVISRLTPDGRVIYMNTVCEEVTGYKTEDMLGEELLSKLYPGELMEPVLDYLKIAAQGGNARDYELTMSSRTGELHRILWSSFHRFGPNGELLEIVSLGVDVTARRKAEAERERLQEEVIAMQAAKLAEMSTPLIPINDDIVVMALVGSIDEVRARQILDTLLSGISKSRATTAILDVTGVVGVDARVAGALLGAARAVRLLGAQVILTGICPDAAQILVRLGINLEGIVTRGTLQSGIAYALQRG